MDSVLSEEKKIKRQIGNLIDENRVVNFSDAVFAFAATLLVLKIDLPQIANPQDAEFIKAFATLWPQYVANIISFLIIGYYWLNHHTIFGLLKKFNFTIVWLNIIFLIFLSFLPFPIDLYGDYMMTPFIVAFYLASLAVVGYLLAGIWWYASYKNKLVGKELGKNHINYYLARNLIAPLVFTLAIPLAYIHPMLAQFSWILVIIGIVIINKDFKIKRVSEIEKESL